jgi:hypothetical protein
MRLGFPAQTGDEPGNAHDQSGRNAEPSAAFQGRAVGAQLLNDFCATKHCGKHDWRHPDTVVGVDVGALLEQQVHDLLVAFEGDATEGSLAVIVAAINVGTVLQQHPCGFDVAIVAGQHEQRVAFGIGQVHGHASPDHRRERLNLAIASEIERHLLQLGVTLFFSLGDTVQGGGGVSMRPRAASSPQA